MEFEGWSGVFTKRRGRTSIGLHKMCCRKLLKYKEIIRIPNKLSGIYEGLQILYYLIKRECQSIPCSALIFCLTLSSTLDLSVCCLPFSSFSACLFLFAFSLFLTCVSVFLCQPNADSLVPHLSILFLLLPTPLTPLCLSLSCLCWVLSLEMTVLMWRNTCPKTFPFLQYCGLIKDIFSPDVFCLSKCSVIKPPITDILNLQESQKQLLQSNYLHWRENTQEARDPQEHNAAAELNYFMKTAMTEWTLRRKRSLSLI